MAENFISQAADFVTERPVESAGIGLLALAGGTFVGRKVLSNIAMKEFAPTAAAEVGSGLTARAVGKGVLFAADDGTTIMARKGLLQVASPEVAGTLQMTNRATTVALADGTTIKNGGFLSRGEDIWTKVGGGNRIKAHSWSSSHRTPDFQAIKVGDNLTINPTSVQFRGGDMQVRSISGPGDPVDVMRGKFGNGGTFENVAERSFTKNGVTFTPRGFQVGEPYAYGSPRRSYETLIKDLTH